MTDLELQETLARINQMYMKANGMRQDMYWKPWVVISTVLTAGAALFTAGAVVGGLIVKLFTH